MQAGPLGEPEEVPGVVRDQDPALVEKDLGEDVVFRAEFPRSRTLVA
jgi:hypothetical protein